MSHLDERHTPDPIYTEDRPLGKPTQPRSAGGTV